MQPFDLVIRGGTVATATDSFKADVGIRGATMAAIAEGLDKGKKEIDARGKLVLPGGVDSHGHIEQLSASGLMNADTFESATTAAAYGGTTTVISFAAQHVGMSLKTVVDEYHQYAERGAVVDYAFHMILADPREEVLEKEVPPLVKAGHASLKVFMTYDRLKVDDEQLLNVLQSRARQPRDGVRACRKPRHDLVDGQAAGEERLHGAEIPLDLASARVRAGGLPAADRLRGAGRPADHDLPRLDRRGRGGDPAGARRRA